MPEAQGKSDYYIGVDLGGTKILAGVFTPQMKCIGRAKISTKAQRGFGEVIARIARAVQDAVDECDLNLRQIKGIGLGAPGAVDPESGNVIFAPNLGWENLPVRKELEEHLSVPVFLENDTNISALGVHVAELNSKPSSMVGIFIGTGIGAGIILDGQLHSGYNHGAGEIGHMTLQIGGPECRCGNHGCFEALAGRQAIFRRIQSEVKNGKKTLLTEMLGEDLADMRSGDLRKAIRRGDKLVDRIVEETAEYIGIAVGNVINLLNPEVIVLGGGVIDALEDEMMSIISETARDYALSGIAKGIEIIATKLGDDAGITGGAVLARRRTK